MAKRRAYSLIYTTSFRRQLKLVEPKYQGLIREALEKHMSHWCKPETASL